MTDLEKLGAAFDKLRALHGEDSYNAAASRERSVAMEGILEIGLASLIRIADAAERHNEAVKVIAARRFNIDGI